MSETQAIDLIREMLWISLALSSPMLGLGLFVGLLISIFQAVTSIHEMTLTFVPKILAVGFVLLFLFPWMLTYAKEYTTYIFEMAAMYGK